MTNEEYWQQRCLLAEKCLEASPCDNDITSKQIDAHTAYSIFLEDNETPYHVIGTAEIITPTKANGTILMK